MVANSRSACHVTCMTGKAPRRPKDLNQLAKSIVDIANGSETDDTPMQSSRVKDPAAVRLGRPGGLKHCKS